MSLPLMFNAVVALFPLSELGLTIFKRASLGSSTEDRGSLRLLWGVIVVSVAAGFSAQHIPYGKLHLPPEPLYPIAIGLLLVGLLFRWWAILMLGKYFTVDVAIAPDQHIVQTGPYRYLRHPSYTGLLLAFLGMALGLNSLLSLALILIPIGAALARRIIVEEQALHAAFPGQYADYCRRTWRLIPGLI